MKPRIDGSSHQVDGRADRKGPCGDQLGQFFTVSTAPARRVQLQKPDHAVANLL